MDDGDEIIPGFDDDCVTQWMATYIRIAWYTIQFHGSADGDPQADDQGVHLYLYSKSRTPWVCFDISLKEGVVSI